MSWEKLPFFQGLNPKLLATLSAGARCESVPRDTMVFNRDGTAERFYAIESGTVSLECHSPLSGTLVIARLEAGDMLGWSWLYPPYRWLFDARAVTPCQLWSLDAAALRKLIDSDAEFGREVHARMGRILVKRLQATRIQLLEGVEHCRLLPTERP